MTVTDRQIPYAEGIYRQLTQKGIRVEKDFRNEKLGFKIREAQVQKIPYMVVVGDREVEGRNDFSPQAKWGNIEIDVPSGFHQTD